MLCCFPEKVGNKPQRWGWSFCLRWNARKMITQMDVAAMFKYYKSPQRLSSLDFLTTNSCKVHVPCRPMDHTIDSVYLNDLSTHSSPVACKGKYWKAVQTPSHYKLNLKEVKIELKWTNILALGKPIQMHSWDTCSVPSVTSDGQWGRGQVSPIGWWRQPANSPIVSDAVRSTDCRSQLDLGKLKEGTFRSSSLFH